VDSLAGAEGGGGARMPRGGRGVEEREGEGQGEGGGEEEPGDGLRPWLWQRARGALEGEGRVAGLLAEWRSSGHTLYIAEEEGLAKMAEAPRSSSP
jgi:hypothetical protein